MTIENDPALFSSGRKRNDLDRYWTAPWLTEELLRFTQHSNIPPPVWEPSAGRGDISRIIKERGLPVYSTDIDMSEFDTSIGPGHEGSFLDEFEVPWMVEGGDVAPQVGPCRSILMNPPYSAPRGIADAFLRHGLSFFADDGIMFMAALLRSEFNTRPTRRDIFGCCEHYMGELVLTVRPRWDYGDPDAPEKAAPRHPFSWFLWKYGWAAEKGAPIQIYSYMPKGFKP